MKIGLYQEMPHFNLCVTYWILKGGNLSNGHVWQFFMLIWHLSIMYGYFPVMVMYVCASFTMFLVFNLVSDDQYKCSPPKQTNLFRPYANDLCEPSSDPSQHFLVFHDKSSLAPRCHVKLHLEQIPCQRTGRMYKKRFTSDIKLLDTGIHIKSIHIKRIHIKSSDSWVQSFIPD